LVVSPGSYNRRTGLALFCPITSRKRGYPFEVDLAGTTVEGVVLSDQLRSLDWKERRAKFIGKASAKVVAEVMAKVLTLIEVETE
jgi:mRNA interferase MazF